MENKRHLPPELWTYILRSLPSASDLLTFTLTSKSNRELVFAQNALSKRIFSLAKKKQWKEIECTVKLMKRHSSHLKILDLSGSRLADTKSIASLLATFPDIKSLSIASARFRLDNRVLATIPFPSTLLRLDLSYCRFFDGDVQHILTSTTHLKSLCLSHCMSIKGTCLEHLPMSIESCDLSHMWNLDGESLNHLTNRTRLTKLGLANCKKITNQHLQQLPVSLLSLDLSDIPRISDEGLQNLPPRLTKLFLRRCYNVTSKLFEYAPKTLLKLNVDYCKVGSLDGISTQLHTLDVGYCWRVFDDQLATLSNLTSLHHLNLTGCENITDAGLSYLPSSIVWLNLTECYKISDAGLLQLPENLEYLDLSYCWHVSDEGLFENLPPSLQTLVVLRYLEDETNPESMANVHKNLTHEGLDTLAKTRGIKVIIKDPAVKALAPPKNE